MGADSRGHREVSFGKQNESKIDVSYPVPL